MWTTPELDFVADDEGDTIRYNKERFNVTTTITYVGEHGRTQATFTASVPQLVRWFAECYSTNDDETDAALLASIFEEGTLS